MTNPNLDRLRELLAEVDDLRRAATVLFWDQRVMMPPRGGEARADHLGTITRLLYEGWSDERLGELLEELRPFEESQDYESDEASLIRFARNESTPLTASAPTTAPHRLVAPPITSIASVMKVRSR